MASDEGYIDSPIDIDDQAIDIEDPAIDIDEPAIDIDDPAIDIDDPWDDADAYIHFDPPVLLSDQRAPFEYTTPVHTPPASPEPSPAGISPVKSGLGTPSPRRATRSRKATTLPRKVPLRFLEPVSPAKASSSRATALHLHTTASHSRTKASSSHKSLSPRRSRSPIAQVLTKSPAKASRSPTKPAKPVKKPLIAPSPRATKKAKKSAKEKEPKPIFDDAWAERITKSITADRNLHLRILRYEPINFDVFIQLTAHESGAASGKFKFHLRALLDKLAINFYGADGISWRPK